MFNGTELFFSGALESNTNLWQETQEWIHIHFFKYTFFLVFYLSEKQCGTCWYLFPWKTFPQWSFGFLVLDVPFFPRYSQKLTWIIPRKVFVRKDTFLFLFSVARERMWEILICDPDIFLWKTLSVKFRFQCACLSLPHKYSQKLI